MVARPLVEYHMATRTGCSDRRYHWEVRREKRGRQPASKRPRRARETIKPPKLQKDFGISTRVKEMVYVTVAKGMGRDLLVSGRHASLSRAPAKDHCRHEVTSGDLNDKI